MNIAATQYSANYESLEIFLSGCDGACGEYCHNRELWDFNMGNPYGNMIDDIITKIRGFSFLIKEVWVTGGEPLLQDMRELGDFLYRVSLEKPIMLFTRFDIEEVPEFILYYCDKIKCGRYIKELSDNTYTNEGIKLASINQKIYIKNRDY